MSESPCPATLEATRRKARREDVSLCIYRVDRYYRVLPIGVTPIYDWHLVYTVHPDGTYVGPL